MSSNEKNRSSFANGKLKQLFSTQTPYRRRKGSTSSAISLQSMPGLGREMSLMGRSQGEDNSCRYLRIFCEHVCRSAEFKTISVRSGDTVSQCVEKVVQQLASEGFNVGQQCFLFEAIGKLPLNSKAITESGEVIDPGENFMEQSSRPLPPNELLMNVFSLMVPAPGLCRRFELRKQPAPFASPNLLGTPNSSDSKHFTVGGNGAPLLAPHGPFLLLIKGTRPESDFLVHEFSTLRRGRHDEMTMGTSEYDDIRLYLPPDAGISRENIIVNGNGYIDSESPIRFKVKADLGNTNTKAIWLCVHTTYNAIQPECPLSVALNWETITDSANLPFSKCLEPGDIIRVETSNLAYVFVFKDSTTLPEHKLHLGFLTLPQLPPVGGKPPTGQNGSRSAVRTARIGALVRKSSNAGNHSVSSSNVLPSVLSADVVVQPLFPHTSPKSCDSKWSEIGGILPDVGVAAGCFAHLLRSVVKHGLDTGGHNYATNANEDEVLRELTQALWRELEKLNRLASQHLIPAIWEAAFCYYLAQYLSPGWMKSATSLHSRPRVVENRRNIRGRNADRNSTSSTADSPSEVFNSPIQRPRQLHPTSALLSDGSEAQQMDLEQLPIISALRDKVAKEADNVMDQAVHQSLKARSREVTELCRLFGSSSTSESVRQIREAQDSLLGKLDQVGAAITQALTTGNRRIGSPSSGMAAIRLTQAQPYNGNGKDRRRRAAASVELDGGGSSHESSLHRNDSSDIDSEDADDTSPSGFSSLRIDEENRSTPGEEEDTGFGGSTTGVSTKGAQQRVEAVFFSRFLVGISKRIIEEFLTNDAPAIRWETGVQVLNLVKALQNWMHNAGVQNYKEALQPLSDFASLMATPPRELLGMSWRQICTARPSLPVPLLCFLLNKYENGRGMQETSDWAINVSRALGGKRTITADDLSKHWQETEGFYIPPKSSRIELNYLPPDLATLFNAYNTKLAVDGFDSILAERNQAFRWSALIKNYPPPAMVTKDSGSVCGSTPGKRSTDSFGAKQRDSNEYSDFRDFAEHNAEVNGPKSKACPANDLLLPIPSTDSPSRSLVMGRPYKYRRATATELSGSRRSTMSELSLIRRTNVQRVVPVPGGGFRSRAGVYDLNGSSQNVPDYCLAGTISLSPAGNCARKCNQRGTNSTLSLPRSANARSSPREAQKICDDWSDFKKSLSRPTTPSTIEADAVTPNTSLCANQPSLMTQSAYDFDSYLRRRRGDSLSSFMDWNLRKSQQSLISLGLDKQAASTVMNVQVEKVANENYGLKFVEGHLTRFGKVGVYVKAITSNSTASRANIQVGDRILAINGKDVTGMTFAEVCNFLKDCVSRVTLTIERGLVDNPDNLLGPSSP